MTGKLNVMLRLDWNAGVTDENGVLQDGMHLNFDKIVYGPATAPGSAWTAGTQYWAVPGGILAGFGMSVGRGGGYRSQAGYAGAFRINDTSPATVVPGKSYAVSANVGSSWIQLYALISGASTGSTVLPGFGLWNLESHPNEWIYVTPMEFDGFWEITLHSPISDAPVLLSIEYAPVKNYGSGAIESRLVFTCRGGSLMQTRPPVLDDSAPALPGKDGPVGTQYIQARRGNAEFVLRHQDGTLIEK
jgi:hypothetical protein